ncbi:hypothetical protein RCH12_001690 [Cryobacterium sp. MP_3.1]|uniref:hypothetical protein n=1 Tax=Cryobacterium sp. MP_3.1 TaxID=3071711 RepID=UPI002E00CE29|nr:hypothetical protein [Cryobacterium sp. MP_3.1]
MPVPVFLPVLSPTGILLPDSAVATHFFAIFSAFVGINTVIYVVLAVAKILPKIYLTDWLGGRNRRSVDRSIYGADPAPGQPAERVRDTAPPHPQ